MQDLQRSFVEIFFSSQDSWAPANDTEIVSGTELNFYLGSGAMIWHIAGAWKQPLSSDELAKKWLAASETAIASVAVKSIPVDAQLKLAEEFSVQGQMEEAAKVVSNIILACHLPKPESIAYCMRCFEYLDNVLPDQRTRRCDDIEGVIAMQLFQTTQGHTPESKMGMTRMLTLHERGANVKHTSECKSLDAAGLLNCCVMC